MEDTLGEMPDKIWLHKDTKVLILVVMEDTLGEQLNEDLRRAETLS